MLRPFLAVALALLSCSPCLLRSQVATPSSDLAAGMMAESLVLSPGDQVRIHIVEAPELDQAVQVDDKGRIPLAIGGNVNVSGLSPAEAAQAVSNTLIKGQFMLNPHVSVAIERYATQSVTVIGQVKSPGSYFIATRRTLLDVLALAGGMTEVADRNVTVERGITDRRAVYNVSNQADVALNNNPVISPGDRVIVSHVQSVYMIGDFVKPGGYPAATNDSRITLLQAVAFAGGTPPTAVPSHARLIHRNPDGTYLDRTIQLSAIQKGRSPDFALDADDIVYLPYSYLRNIVVNINSLLAAAASSAIYIH